MTASEYVEKWSAHVLAAAAFIGMIWNRLGLGKKLNAKLNAALSRIKSVEVQLDGMLEYKSRADIAEATVTEQHRQEDRADQKERDGK